MTISNFSLDCSEEAPHFDAQWEAHAQRSLPGWNRGRAQALEGNYSSKLFLSHQGCIRFAKSSYFLCLTEAVVKKNDLVFRVQYACLSMICFACFWAISRVTYRSVKLSELQGPSVKCHQPCVTMMKVLNHACLGAITMLFEDSLLSIVCTCMHACINVGELKLKLNKGLNTVILCRLWR